MNRMARMFAPWIGALVLASLPLVAMADTQADAARLRDARKAERYEVPSSQSIKAGGAQIFVNAPLASVRQVVQDFGHYQDFMPGFKRSRVVQRNKEFTDVYLQVPILHGAATVWAVSRFGAPRKEANGTEVIEGTMQQGNVNDFHATWRLIPVDATHTILKAEMLIVPKLPLPGSVVTPELSYASDRAVTSSRNRAEAAAVRVAAGAPTTP